ncbi:MAG: phage tail protein [Thiotrichaceae bacterium]|nr:phage tail protein [Thiotrichaceae bacterium]
MAKVSPQMVWGGIEFTTNTTALNKIAHSTTYEWAAVGRLDRPHARQFLGKGEDNITLTGEYYPAVGGNANALEAVRSKADKGTPEILMDGSGKNWGKYVCTDVKDDKSELMDDAKPQKVSFTVTLKKYYPDGATS